jgi:uncharacterized protein YvpB
VDKHEPSHLKHEKMKPIKVVLVCCITLLTAVLGGYICSAVINSSVRPYNNPTISSSDSSAYNSKSVSEIDSEIYSNTDSNENSSDTDIVANFTASVSQDEDSADTDDVQSDMSDDQNNELGYDPYFFVTAAEMFIPGFDQNETVLPVQTIEQMPEMPTGCEITSLTMILNYYGFDVDKTYMAENYLVCSDDTYPEKNFIGDPFSFEGCFCYEQPIANAANDFFRDEGRLDLCAFSFRNMTVGDIENDIDSDEPVVAWITGDFSMPVYDDIIWTDYDGAQYHPCDNIHVVCVIGYSDKSIIFNDPGDGETYQVDKNIFNNVFSAMGGRAVVVGQSENNT